MNTHLELLKAEHVSLQFKYAELKRRYDMLLVNRCFLSLNDEQDVNEAGFVKKLVDCVVHLYNKDLYR